MTDDLRSACQTFIDAPAAGPVAQPLALGWKLANGALPSTDVDALRTALARAATSPHGLRRWCASPALRAFFAEYAAVRARRSASASFRRTRLGCPRP